MVFFPISEQKQLLFIDGKLFRHGFQYCFLLVRENSRWRNWIISKRHFFWCSFSYFELKPIRLLGKKFLAELLKQHSSCPNGSFEVKIFLSKMKLFMNIARHWPKMCWLLAKNVRLGSQSSILRVEENFLRKMKCFTKTFHLIHFSGLWVETFRACGEKICGMLLKKAFTYPEEWSEENCLVEDRFFS